MKTLIDWMEHNLSDADQALAWYWRLAIVAGIFLAAFLFDFFFRRIFTPALHRLASSTKTGVDDVILSDKVIRVFGDIIPSIVLLFALPLVTRGTLAVVVSRLAGVYLIVCITRFLCILADALFQALLVSNREKGRDWTRLKSLKGLVQTIQIFLSVIAAILAVSVLIDKSPAYLISGLGVMAGVMMLVFQDLIKGLVAGVQLLFNDMVSVGDWICMPSRNVDGVVIEITLTTVKVQNWDNTILTVPPCTLLSDTFQNWKGMQEGNGRRITRTVNVDMYSVRFLTASEVEQCRQEGILPETARVGEATNLEVFRRQMQQYISQSPDFNPRMTHMVRQLNAGCEGIPVQLYAFSRTKVWEEYEEIQARLVEYALASLQKYGLTAFQRSGGKALEERL